MKLKRRFLSEHGRWVVSVWNKGRLNKKTGEPLIELGGPWTVYHDGREVMIPSLDNPFGVEIGVVTFDAD